MRNKDVRKVLQERFLTKEEILKLLNVKEYWLDEDEQKIIDDYRKQKWGREQK